MIRSAADKIKHCRKYFNLSQSDFSWYGISQNYLSMIESEKRIPSNDLLEAIYNGFYDLTSGKIEQLYTKDAFLLSTREEIINWLENNFEETEKLIDCYDEVVTVCQRYKVYDLLYSINYRIGNYYKNQSEYLLAIEFFLKSIELEGMSDLNISNCYYMVARCMWFTYSYESSLTYYFLAYRHLENKKSYIAYKIQYCIALVFRQVDEIEQCLYYLNIILRECDDKLLKSGAYIIKTDCLLCNNQFEIVKKMLYRYINYPIYKSHLKYINYILAYCFLCEKNYTEALVLVKKMLDSYQNDYDLDKSKLILSLIYREMKEFDKAIQYCIDSKNSLTSEYRHVYSSLWYKQAMILCLEVEDYTQLSKLIIEIKSSENFKKLRGEIKEYLLQQAIKCPVGSKEQIDENYKKIKYICEHI